jgi:hypothetical protein
MSRVLLFGALAGLGALAAGCSADRLASPEAGFEGAGISRPGEAFNASSASFRFTDGHTPMRVDRMGMPAIATAVITSKNAYNAANPTDDAAGQFVPEIITNVQALHDALDDDLTAAGLTPCATGDCVGQAAPFVVPDVIRINPSQPAGFPNGRRLTDPVIDVTLALVLLDLGTHPVTTLVGVNPTRNDQPFTGSFPYLARRHPSGLQALAQ